MLRQALRQTPWLTLVLILVLLLALLLVRLLVLTQGQSVSLDRRQKTTTKVLW